VNEHHTSDRTDGQFPWPPGPGAGTWPGPAPGPDLGDPYGDDAPGPGWQAPPQPQDQPGLFADLAAGREPAAAPAASRARTWPAPSARTRARPWTRRRPATLLAALVLLGAASGAGITALSQGQTVRFTPADNPAASQYTPSAGPVTQPPATASPSPGPASPPATMSPSPAPASDPPAISQAGAAKVLAAFWTANNQANQARSATLLSGIEGGTSYAIDAGAYQAGRAEDPDGSGYTPIGAASGSTVYWIPRLAPGTYPRWFAARVAYIRAGQPGHGIVTGYLIFAQAAAGAAWKDVLEPYLLHATTDPFILTGTDGYATAVPPGAAVQPGQLPAQIAASLDGAAGLIQDPGNLADMRDRAYFAAHLPAGSSVTGTHAPGGTVYALETVGGGAIVFCDLTAQVSITAPPGQQVTIAIPGYYTPGQPVTSADISYASQFALYVPPAGQGGPQLLADASGITG
jgi:hypothetical protein